MKMSVINLAERRIVRQVDELFAKMPARYGAYCTNPITGGCYIHGDDPIEPQKEAARRALFNREWFAIHGPADAQPLPISSDECEAARLRGDLLHYILGLYGRSLEGKDPREHPPFADYVSGVLWEAERVDGIIGTLPNIPDELEKLKMRFPPRELAGMGPGFCWLRPKLYAEVMPRYRRSRARDAAWRAKQIKIPHLPPTYEIVLPKSVQRAAARANAYYAREQNSQEPNHDVIP
jgi:hypothetical protein